MGGPGGFNPGPPPAVKPGVLIQPKILQKSEKPNPDFQNLLKYGRKKKKVLCMW